MMSIFLSVVFLFCIGSSAGWCIEVIFRRFFSRANPERKWINPGFLVGPCLPLYGFSLCILYLLASCESFLTIDNQIVRKLVLFAIMAVCVTLLEYFVGLFCLKVLKVRLWDYSKNRGNIHGIVCPRFTLFWAILSALYYFLVHPNTREAIEWLSKNLAFSFFIGLYMGILIIDAVISAQLLAKIRAFAHKQGIVVRFEELKSHIRSVKEKQSKREHVFLLAMQSKSVSLAEQLAGYFESHFAHLGKDNGRNNDESKN